MQRKFNARQQSTLRCVNRPQPIQTQPEPFAPYITAEDIAVFGYKVATKNLELPKELFVAPRTYSDCRRLAAKPERPLKGLLDDIGAGAVCELKLFTSMLRLNFACPEGGFYEINTDNESLGGVSFIPIFVPDKEQ